MTTSLRIGDSMTIPNMNTLGVDDSNDNGIIMESDGIVGLTPTTSGNPDLLLDKLYENDLIDMKAFAIDYKDTSGQSSIYFGGWEETAFEGELGWIDILNNGYWAITVSKVTYNGNDVGGDIEVGDLDTGTSLTYFPTSVFEGLIEEIKD